ncbi:6-hydroxynicotinate 3-monooxygenase [Bradyrhizobium lablabi]|uniref:6-hydroxynicotinate 3-monooxygenase n=1 Tax=Bradyrhizobium lablabi TaxID=722472 RepID=A0A1M6N5S5_9BRAD|nr:FAD-dependent monooxygenase [Bradyrhizobium lablabi]SHJ91069.1 6-hydroxynicotinate 3-monooxygenase [Bradyrhizobium lablabi]
MSARKTIAVIGAGLGGLSVAGFLQRAGFPVTVYEQAPAFSRIGAGIILSANAMKAFRRLGIEQDLIETGIKPESYVSRAWDSGETMYEIKFDAASEARYGGPYMNIHRGDLHGVLERVVTPGTIAFDHRLVGLDESREAVRLSFENGVRIEADIVIGADGIRSRVRENLLGFEPPRFVGAVAQRAIFPTERLRGSGIADCTKWWGPDRHILPYFMTSRRDEIYVIGVIPAAQWDSEASSLPCSRDEMLESFAGFHVDLRRVLEVADDVSLWPIYDRERNDRWSGGRIVLLGDACHPMRPFMAAGGAMAVEDGVILSRCLAACDDHGEAFRCYEATRIPRVTEVQRISIENSWMRGPTETDWFYCYDPCLAPLAAPD